MIDPKELVAAIKRIRGGGYGPALHLLVPSALPAEVVDVLAQLDVKVVVWKWLVDGAAYLVDASTKTGRFLNIDPTFKMPNVDHSAWMYSAWMRRRP